MSFRYGSRRRRLGIASAGAGVFDDLSVPIGSDVTEQYSCVCDPRLTSIAQKKETVGLASSTSSDPFESKVCSKLDGDGSCRISSVVDHTRRASTISPWGCVTSTSAFSLARIRQVRREITTTTSGCTLDLVQQIMRAWKAMANRIVPCEISSLRWLMELTVVPQQLLQ